MLNINVNTANPADIARAQAQLNAVEMAIGAESGGLERLLSGGLAQLDRFVAANIEVDTGRTKNSIFPHMGGSGNGVTASLNTNVRYAPYVRNSNGGEQFFNYAGRVEGPRVVEAIGNSVVVAVEEAFA